jgi:hypothetical protein
LELLRPVRALALPAGGGDWPAQRSLLELDGDAELLGIRAAADGADLLLLREATGGHVSVGVCVDGQAAALGATDLRGWGAPESWAFSPTLNPWQIRGFILDEGSP